MTDASDGVSFIQGIIRHPYYLQKRNEFPDCSKVAAYLTKHKAVNELAGILFRRLCQLTGFAYAFWAVNLGLVMWVIGILGYHWGFDRSLSEPLFCDLTCKALVAVIGAIFVVNTLIYSGIRVYSNQIADKLAPPDSATAHMASTD